MGEIASILNTYGPYATPYVLLIVAYGRGYIATGRELQQERDALARERVERERERTELRHEITFWRDIAWSNSRIADQVVGALPIRKEAT